MQSVGTVAIGGAVTGVVALGGAMIATAVDGTKMAMDLESQMDVIASVLNKTEQEAQPLNDLILQLGINPNLKVSTLEAADAIETLATAGLDMNEIIGGAAEATVLLSNASGGDFSQSAEIMTDSMAIFTDSISSYQDAVNGVISVSNASKFTVDDYALALAQAGGIAGTVGVEFDDFNTSIAAISPLFASGSDAGTSYKTMLQRLVPSTNPAVDAMRDLGLFAGLTDKEFEKTQSTIAKYQTQLAALDPKSKNFAKKSEELTGKISALNSTLVTGSNAFYDANGNLKDMAEISTILNKALADLSEEEKSTALTTIFGTDAMRAAVGMADAGVIAYTDAALAAKELGVSQEAVNAVMEGGITKFEAMQLQMGKTDALEQAKQRVDNAKGVLEVFGGVVEAVQISIGQGFLPTIKELGLQFTNFLSDNSGSIIAFFRSFAEGLAYGASFIPQMLSGLVALGAGAGDLVGDIANFGTLIGGAIAPMINFLAPVASAVAEFLSWKDVMVALGVAVGSVVLPALATLAATLWPIVVSVGAVIAASALLRNAWESDFLGMRTVLSGAVAAIGSTLSSLKEYFVAVVDDGDYLNDWLTHLPDAMRPGVQSFGELIAATLNYRDAVIDAGLGSIESQESIGLFPAALQPAIAWIDNFAGALKRLADGSDLTVFKTSVTASMSEIGNSVKDYFSGDISLGGLATAVSSGFSDISSAISTFFGGQDFSAFLTEIQWSEFIEKLSWENVLGTAALIWSDYISPLLWDGWLTVVSWADWLTSLDWTKIITTAIDWATWIPALSWAGFVTVVDWALYIGSIAWSGFISVLNWLDATGEKIDWSSYVSALSWENAVKAIEWASYIVSFTWDSFITKLEWTGTIATLTSWGDYIKEINWGSFVIMLLDWATWIPALVWNGFVAIIDWAAWLVSLDWGGYVSTVDWSQYIAAAFSWSSYIVSVAWSDWIPAAFSWSSYVFSLTWSSFVSKLNWPSISWPGFSTFVPTISWPTISWPGWGSFIPAFPGWPDIGAMIQDAIGSAASYLPGTNAVGTNFWGGGVSLVGETGPELVYMPRGSKVAHSGETRALLAGAGGDVQVNVYATVANGIDVNALAYEIADVLRRRNR